MQRLAGLALIALLFLGAAPKKTPAPPAAPDVVPHSIALFLGSMSKDGARQVTFKATARGTHFFFEEPTGVTIYRYDRGHYVKHEFVAGATLARALKRYAGK